MQKYIYDHKNLQNQIMRSIYEDALAAGKTGLANAMSDLMKKPFTIDFTKEKIDVKGLEAGLTNAIENAINRKNINPNFEPVLNIDLNELFNMNEEDLISRIDNLFYSINDRFEKGENPVKTLEKYFAAVEVALKRGLIKMDDQSILDRYENYFDMKKTRINPNTGLEEFTNSLKTESKKYNQIRNSIQNQWEQKGNDFKIANLISPFLSDIKVVNNEFLNVDTEISKYYEHLELLDSKVVNSNPNFFNDLENSIYDGKKSAESAIKEINEFINKKNELDEKIESVTVYRGVTNQAPFMSDNSVYNGTFVTNSLKAAKEYAEEAYDIGLVYEAQLKLQDAFSIDGNGSEWTAIKNLGNQNDEASKNITIAYNSLQTLKNTLIDYYNSDKQIKRKIETIFTDEMLSDRSTYDGIETDNYKQIVGNSLSMQYNWSDLLSNLKEDLKKTGKYSDEIDKILLDIDSNAKKFFEISQDVSNMYGVHSTDGYFNIGEKLGYKVVEAKNIIDSSDGKLITDYVFNDESLLSGEARIIEKYDADTDKFIKVAKRRTSEIEKAARANVEAAKKATEEAQDSNSPSKVAEALGEYWGIGYAEGIRLHIKDVENAVEELISAGKITSKDLFDNDIEDELKIPIQNIINKNGLSSGGETRQADEFRKISEDTVEVLSHEGKTESEIVSLIREEIKAAEALNEVTKEHLILLDKKGKVISDHLGSTSNVNGTFTKEQLARANGGKIQHVHPGKASFFGGKDLSHILQDKAFENIKQIELLWGDSTLSIDKSTLTKQSQSTLLNIMRNVRTALTETYTDNAGGTPSQDVREHINAIEKEIFKSIAQKLNISVSENGEQTKAVTDALSDVDKAIIQRFKAIESNVVQDINPAEIISNKSDNSAEQPAITANQEVAESANEARIAEEKLHEEQRNSPTPDTSQREELEKTEKQVQEVANTVNILDECIKKYLQYGTGKDRSLKLGEQITDHLEKSQGSIGEQFDKAASYYGLYYEMMKKAGLEEEQFTYKGVALNDQLKERYLKLKQTSLVYDEFKSSVLELINAEASSNASSDAVIKKSKAKAKARKSEVEITEKQSTAEKQLADNIKKVSDASSSVRKQISQSQNIPSSVKNGFIDEEQVVKKTTSEESFSLDDLRESIVKVREEVEKKTQEFELEGQIVSNVVRDEQTSLYLLITTLKEVQAVIEDISTSFGGINFNISTTGLKPLLNSLNEVKIDDKLTSIYTYLDDFAKSVNSIDFNNNLTEQLNQLLSKKDELRDLATIIKSNKKDIDKAKSSVDNRDGDVLKNSYKTLRKSEKEFQFLSNKENLNPKEASRLKELEVLRKQARDTISSIGEETKKNTKYEEEYNKEVQRVTASVEAFNDAAEAQRNIDLKDKLTSLINKSEKEISKSKYKDEYKNEITKQIENARGNISGTNEVIEEAIANLERFLNTPTKKENLESSFIALEKLGLDVADVLSKNTKMSSDLSEKFIKLGEDIEEALNSGKFKDGDKTLNKFKQTFLGLQKIMKQTNQDGLSWWDKLKKQYTGVLQNQIARYFSINDIIRYIRQISSTVIEVDSALTELRKVSDASNERLQQSFTKSAETAKELGSSISDVINVTSDWARLGYSVDEAEELARVTTLFKNVGDNMSAEDASSYMVSTLQGFELAAKDAESIADKFNEVANNFAIDTQGIGESLQRSAASFNAANTDLNQSIALITATNAVVQNPESVGTMWKTVSARIRGAKTELEDMGEDTEGMVESTSKLRDLVKGMTRFDIMEDEDTFKSIYDIIVGIGEKWQDLSDIDQAALLEALAGKRAGNALAAALNNVDDMKKAYETAKDSAGSVAKEQENYEKSIQYSLDRLKATAQDLANDFIQSDWIKTAVDALNNILEKVDSLIEHTGSLIPILTTIGTIIAGIKINGFAKGIFDNLLGDNKDKTSGRDKMPSPKQYAGSYKSSHRNYEFKLSAA